MGIYFVFLCILVFCLHLFDFPYVLPRPSSSLKCYFLFYLSIFPEQKSLWSFVLLFLSSCVPSNVPFFLILLLSCYFSFSFSFLLAFVYVCLCFSIFFFFFYSFIVIILLLLLLYLFKCQTI